MCHESYSKGSRYLLLLSKRCMSSQQAAVALRPFYFAVHPDRFANNDEARRHNEKSLQHFNGYLNGLRPSQAAPEPVHLSFYIRHHKEKKLREVQFILSGPDIASVVRHTLEVCGLPTTNLPQEPSKPVSPNVRRYTDAEIDAAKLNFRQFKRKPAFVRRDNLEAAMRNLKETAVITGKTHKAMLKHIEEEVNLMKKEVGMTEVIWTTDWTIGHMRRCLVSINRLIEHSNLTSGKNPIVNALKGYPLRFGKGSFVCCDGGIRFGVDSVPEDWENACQNAKMLRQQLPQLDVAKRQISSLFGRADVVIQKESSLAQSLTQMQMLIAGIAQCEKTQRMRLKCLGMETVVEVMTSYDEFAVGNDGRLLIPCNANISLLLDFLANKALLSRTLTHKMQRVKGELEALRLECINDLKLADVTWYDGVNKEELVNSLTRLKKVAREMILWHNDAHLQGPESLRSLLADTSLHFSTNPTIYVMSDGRLSLPLSWT